MKKQLILLVVGALAIGSGILLWPRQSGQNQRSTRYTIGFMSPMTGPYATYSRDILRGVELAVAKANDGKETFKLLVEDSKADSKTALAAFNKLRASGATYIIGDLVSSSTLAVVPQLESQQVILISPTGSDEQIARGSKYAFSIYSSANEEAIFMASLIPSNFLGCVAILYSPNPTAIEMARSARERISKTGGMVQQFEELPKSPADYSATATKMSGCEYTLLFGFPNEIPTFINTANERGVHTRWILPSTMYDPGAASALVNIGDAIDVVAPIMIDSELMKTALPGFAIYHNKYGEKPSIWAALGYDAAAIITLNASASADEFAKKVMTFEYEGASGSISFNAGRHAKKELRVIPVIAGQLQE